MGSKGFLYVLPVLTLILGIAIGRWWSGQGAAPQRANERTVPAPESRPAGASMLSHGSPSGGAPVPTQARAGGMEAPQARDLPGALPAATRPSADPAAWTAPAPPAPMCETRPPDAKAEKAKPSEGNEAAVTKMLAVLFTQPAFRGQFVKQMVAEVNEAVKFSATQQESAAKELEAAMKPLADAFAAGSTMDMKTLEPKFNDVKEDWKRRLTPLLTSEQAAAFQDYLNQHHALSIKMGMDEHGQPKDPDGK